MEIEADLSMGMECVTGDNQSSDFNDDFKHDFSQAIEIKRFMFEENGMIASQPREKISHSTRAMSTVFYYVILSAVNENKIVTKTFTIVVKIKKKTKKKKNIRINKDRTHNLQRSSQTPTPPRLAHSGSALYGGGCYRENTAFFEI